VKFPAELHWLTQRKTRLDSMRQHQRCVVGEWSCALPRNSLRAVQGFDLDVTLRAHGSAQLLSYDSTEGWLPERYA